MRNNVNHFLGQIQTVHKQFLEGKLNKKFMVHIPKLFFYDSFCCHDVFVYKSPSAISTLPTSFHYKKYGVGIKRLMNAIYVIIITINKAMLQLKGERQTVVLLQAAI